MLKRGIQRNKNTIALISGVFILLAFLSKWMFSAEIFFESALIVASLLGLAPIAIQAYEALRVKVVSIDVLVSLAVLGAFLIRNFEESAIVTFLFLFGAYLEQRTLNQTRSAIKELTEMAPESALKQMAHGDFEEVDVEDVKVGDLLLVKTGGKVPVDGTVVYGEGSINEASITGESIPVLKEVTEQVFAGTILDNGTVHIRADRVGEDTTFGKIMELVEEAQDAKSPAERFIDGFSTWYTPAVLMMAFLVWLFTKDVELAITILVLGCPGALVIGVPVSSVAGIGNGARHGVLLKGSEVIRDFSKIDTMIFDKTGTLTLGTPSVSKKLFYGEEREEDLRYLVSVEKESDHPLAKAVLEELGDHDARPVSETRVVKGGGILATVDNHQVVVGTEALMDQEKVPLTQEARADILQLTKEGNSLVLFAVDGVLKVVLGIKDNLRPGVKEQLRKLKKLGVKNLVMLSGDNQGTVDFIGHTLGFTEAHGHMLPEDKAAFVRRLMEEEGQIVAFVGDGINDSPSLALANIGIAMGNGTDVAIETSDVVIMNSDFSRLPHAVGLAKSTARNMVQNIVIAVGVVILLLLSALFGEWMTMSIGMLVHEGSILVVILNGMRLLKYRLP